MAEMINATVKLSLVWASRCASIHIPSVIRPLLACSKLQLISNPASLRAHRLFYGRLNSKVDARTVCLTMTEPIPLHWTPCLRRRCMLAIHCLETQYEIAECLGR
ncbi:hypothetical protein VTK56DRAFT_1305 [Thermocarpiscus australiensis]